MGTLHLQNSSSAIQSIAGGDKGIHTFFKGISTKTNVIVKLEFELAN